MYYNYHPAVCSCPCASQKQEHLSIARTACNTYNFIFIFETIHTVSDLDRPVLSTPDWLVLYF